MPVDTSTYLNYPGLKYLQRYSNVDWEQLANSYLNYSGLKRLESHANVNSEKNFLSHDGLMYLMFAKFVQMAVEKKHAAEEQQWETDSSIGIDYNIETGEISVRFYSDNDSIYVDNGNVGGIQGNGMLFLSVYEGRGLDYDCSLGTDGKLYLIK